ncbi:N-acetylglucosamine-6-phosphate deacetylase [Nocardia seriolae]|uniref:N-acetylglucosamine-6-phosphate deacetylase n=1 Tax=Nocardia seriolae TaxID=37332 RepID=A0ABC8AQF5_9NOCA|nr:amidohydrolase family protein [Nocardia seriolae]APA96401.1 N-acetylglucosamine-6-phosphate deacetylase [Nocardia seriolae]WKY51239.1 amidohydrolase family protein [Nocardia seriolae]GAM46493.1 N-acetylglucosamine-6-phosphate deacetylase [Nocardia seriolae]
MNDVDAGSVAEYGVSHVRGRVIAPAAQFEDAVVSVHGDRVVAVEDLPNWRALHPESAEPEYLGTVLPGLVDIHNHGGAGHRMDTTDPAEATAAAEFHRSRGTTTLLAALVTAEPDLMLAQAGTLRGLAEAGVIGGIHCEGPCLAKTRCGAHDPDRLRLPDPEWTARLLDASGGWLRIMTLAPELPGARELARELADVGVTVSLGHTDADYATFSKALWPSGFATSVTHLGNGMPPMHHRAPGPVAAAITAAARDRVVVELIGDGVHVEPGFAAMVFATADRVALITDAMQAAGMPDGEYRLGPQPVVVRDGVARVPGGSIAGGTADLLRCVRWAVRECGVPLRDAVRAATLTPAAAAGLSDVGDLRPGCRADLLVVDEELRPRRVLYRGRWSR